MNPETGIEEGNCGNTFHGVLWCYVQQPSSCSDLGNSSWLPKEKWSVTACKDRPSKYFMFN